MVIDGLVMHYQTMTADDLRWKESQRTVKRTIALDFDGVLHRYSQGWKDGSIYDDPVYGAVDACRELKRRGYELVVFTARRNEDIPDWLVRHGFPPMPVTNTKPPALFYIDDRAIRFERWAQALCDIVSLADKAGEP